MRRCEVLDSRHAELPFFLKRAEKRQNQPGESYLADILDFCDKITGFVKEGRAPDVTLAKPFNIVLHNVVVPKLGLYGLHGWTHRRIKKCLDVQAQEVVTNGSYSSRGLSWYLSWSSVTWRR